MNEHVTQQARWRTRSQSWAGRANRLSLSYQLFNQNLSLSISSYRLLHAVPERIVAGFSGRPSGSAELMCNEPPIFVAGQSEFFKSVGKKTHDLFTYCLGVPLLNG